MNNQEMAKDILYRLAAQARMDTTYYDTVLQVFRQRVASSEKLGHLVRTQAADVIVAEKMLELIRHDAEHFENGYSKLPEDHRINASPESRLDAVIVWLKDTIKRIRPQIQAYRVAKDVGEIADVETDFQYLKYLQKQLETIETYTDKPV